MLMIVMILTLRKYCEEQRMYLVYIYNSFILNVFLTFFTFLTFIYVVITFKLVHGLLCHRIEELYVSGKTCWPWHAEEPNMVKQFGEFLLADLVHTVFIYTFFFVWWKYQETLCNFSLPCFVFLSGCCGSSGKYCK